MLPSHLIISAPLRRTGLVRAELERLRTDLRRWSDWRLGDCRPLEAWPTGVASAIRYDTPRVMMGKPGSKPPKACPPDDAEYFVYTIDRVVESTLFTLQPSWYRAVHMYYMTRLSYRAMAERLTCSQSTVERMMREAHVWLFNALYG